MVITDACSIDPVLYPERRPGLGDLGTLINECLSRRPGSPDMRSLSRWAFIAGVPLTAQALFRLSEEDIPQLLAEGYLPWVVAVVVTRSRTDFADFTDRNVEVIDVPLMADHKPHPRSAGEPSPLFTVNRK